MIVRIPNFLPETPSWAETFGVDRQGLFAGITVGDASQMFRWIEPGSFRMGSPEDELGRYDDEGPQHEVTIPNGFWIGQTPVTQEFYQAVTGDNPSNFKGDGRRPVEQVDWEQAVEFCNVLGDPFFDSDAVHARLPSEAEWEYACRGGTTAALYSEQNLTSETEACPNLDRLAWYTKNSQDTTHPVGQKTANAWGLQDMLGNVWEWCQDSWHGDYTGAPSDGSAWEGKGSARVIRGGGWARSARYCRSAYRSDAGPGYRNFLLGFRLVLADRFNEGVRPFS